MLVVNFASRVSKAENQGLVLLEKPPANQLLTSHSFGQAASTVDSRYEVSVGFSGHQGSVALIRLPHNEALCIGCNLIER